MDDMAIQIHWLQCYMAYGLHDYMAYIMLVGYMVILATLLYMVYGFYGYMFIWPIWVIWCYGLKVIQVLNFEFLVLEFYFQGL